MATSLSRSATTGTTPYVLRGVSSLRVSVDQPGTRITSLTALSYPPIGLPFGTQVPSAHELRALGKSALASVPSFLVGREGFGSVRWDGPVDLSAVRVDDLSDIVRITRGEVAVYTGRASTLKPPRGAGLNRPATVTLVGVFPESVETLEAYEKDGSTFVSYDPASGAWTFRVRHFSRYGMDLDASDSEDECPRIEDLAASTDPAPPVPSPILKGRLGEAWKRPIE